jgi:hypothetical protein
MTGKCWVAFYGALVFSSFVSAQSNPQSSESDILKQAKPNVRYYYWSENGEGNSGGQVITPISLLSTVSNDRYLLELGGRAAYIYSYNNSTGASGSVSTLSDTVLNATLTFSKSELPFYPFITGSLNVPTGKETLSGKEKNAVMDIDLVEQVRFGEGLNFNLGGGVTVPISEVLSTTISASYNIRGDYIPDGDTEFEYDPGDQFTVYGEVVLSLPDSYTSVGLKYNREDDSEFNGIEYFQPGDSLEIYGTYAGAINLRDTINSTFSYARYSKNEIFDPFTGTFGTESSQGAGDVIRFSLGWQRKVEWGQWGLSGQALVRQENDYDRLNDQFIPSRKSFLIGPDAGFKLSKKISLNMRLQYKYLSDDDFVLRGVNSSFRVLQSIFIVNYDL